MRQLLSSRRGRADSVSFLQRKGSKRTYNTLTIFIFLEILFTDLAELAAVAGFTVITSYMYSLHKVHAEDEKSLVALGSAL